jgi:hypothetical protein
MNFKEQETREEDNNVINDNDGNLNAAMQPCTLEPAAEVVVEAKKSEFSMIQSKF